MSAGGDQPEPWPPSDGGLDLPYAAEPPQAGNQSPVEALDRSHGMAEQAGADAQCTVGVAYAGGDGLSKAAAETVNVLRKAADQSLAGAQYNLGVMYEHGDGLAQDLTEVTKWHRKAAEQGHAAAQFMVGSMYGTRAGVPEEDAQAVSRYRRAAHQALAEAQWDSCHHVQQWGGSAQGRCRGLSAGRPDGLEVRNPKSEIGGRLPGLNNGPDLPMTDPTRPCRGMASPRIA